MSSANKRTRLMQLHGRSIMYAKTRFGPARALLDIRNHRELVSDIVFDLDLL